MKRLLVYMKEYRLRAFLGPFFKLLEAIFELLIPLIVANIIDIGIQSGDKSYIWQRVFLMAALGVIGFLCALTAQYFAAKAAVGFSAKVRRAVFCKIQNSTFSDLDEFGTSTLITRITGDINQLQTGVNIALRLLLRSPFIVGGAFVVALTIDAKVSLIFLAAILLLGAIVFLIMRYTIPLYQNVQKKLDKVTLSVRENLYGTRVLRAFGKEREETERFHGENDSYYTAQRFVGKISALMNPLTFAAINFAVIFMIYVSGSQVNKGILLQGEVVALVNLMSQILIELIKFANMIVTINKSLASARRIENVIYAESERNLPFYTQPGSGNRKEPAAFLEFSDVSFAYKNAAEESIYHVSFSAERGEQIGIIGPTGSGKSTLCSLIPHFYAATGGEVLLDGVNVNTIPEKDLRKRIGVVLQKNALFQGTIRENLLLGGREIPDEKLELALAAAQATEVALQKGGLDGKIEPHGRNLSGGQRQRLCIARALAGAPEILILDDSASALDFATEAALRKAIAALPQKPLTFIVSQRVSSVMHCHKILVMEDGKLLAQGTHEELVHTSPLYAEICRAQLSTEVAK